MNRRRFRAEIELRLARLALSIVPLFSHASLYRLARILGGAAFFFGGSRNRRVAEANLALIFPEMNPVERRRILRKSFETFARSMLDVFWLSRQPSTRLPAIVQLHASYDAILKPGPMICITAHMGNWEVLGMAISQRSGQPLTSVAAAIKNRRVDELFNTLRQVTGQHVVPRKGAVRSLLKALREGSKIALVLDQNTKPAEGGIFVDFLGRAAPVSSAAAMLALRTNAPVVVGVLLPDGKGRYATPPLIHVPTDKLPDNPEEAIQALTQRISDVLSQQIRAYPEYWVWSYKRWKIRPSGESAERYPYYSRPLRATDLPVSERAAFTPAQP